MMLLLLTTKPVPVAHAKTVSSSQDSGKLQVAESPRCSNIGVDFCQLVASVYSSR